MDEEALHGIPSLLQCGGKLHIFAPHISDCCSDMLQRSAYSSIIDSKRVSNNQLKCTSGVEPQCNEQLTHRTQTLTSMSLMLQFILDLVR